MSRKESQASSERNFIFQFTGSVVTFKVELVNRKYIWKLTEKGRMNLLPPMVIRWVSEKEAFKVFGIKHEREWFIMVNANETFHVPFDDEHLYMIELRDRVFDDEDMSSIKMLTEKLVSRNPQDIDDATYSFREKYQFIKDLDLTNDEKFEERGLFVSFPGTSCRAFVANWYASLGEVDKRKVLYDEAILRAEPLPETIFKMIKSADKVCYIVDEHFFKSPWCLAELRFGIEQRMRGCEQFIMSLMPHRELKRKLIVNNFTEILYWKISCINHRELSDYLNKLLTE